NLLREGLDLPEVSLVAILDADKEGFLRSPRSLIQTTGRAARNQNGRVIMFGDRITRAMDICISETERRREIQIAYNLKHGITPTTTKRANKDFSPANGESDYYSVPKGDSKSVGNKKAAKTPEAKSKTAAQSQPASKSTAPSLPPAE